MCRPTWNAIPEPRRDAILDLALEKAEFSPREIACRYTDEERYFVSESSVYCILKNADLITSPAYVLMSAADAFQNPTTRVYEMWQTDFTYFAISHGFFVMYYGPACLSGELRDYLGERGMRHTRGAPYHPQTQGKIKRYHRTMKNVVKLQHYYFPEELKTALKGLRRITKKVSIFLEQGQRVRSLRGSCLQSQLLNR